MSEVNRYRIVLDTNVIVAAGSRWVMSAPPAPLPDHFASRIVHCVTAKHDGLVCEDILAEYIEKLEEFRHPPERIQRYIGYLIGACLKIVIVSTACNLMPIDPDDAIFIFCAIDGQAHFLISDDHHLLDLKESYDPPKIRTREEMREHLSLA